MKEAIWNFFVEMLEADDHDAVKFVVVGSDDNGKWCIVAEWREVKGVWKIYAKLGYNTDIYNQREYSDWEPAEDTVEACLGAYEIDPEKIDWLVGQWSRIHELYADEDGEDFIIVPDETDEEVES